jgi:hypothetical protein
MEILFRKRYNFKAMIRRRFTPFCYGENVSIKFTKRVNKRDNIVFKYTVIYIQFGNIIKNMM